MSRSAARTTRASEKAPEARTAPATSSAPRPRLVHSAGNLAVQAKLRTTSPNDESEREAERFAAGASCGECNASSPCSKCSGPIARKSVAGARANASLPESSLRRLVSGAPLHPELRALMQHRLGHDFSAVRVHTDDAAIGAARFINARAFTAGEQIAFDSGEYRPENEEGRRLVAHELTHVVQQRAGIAGEEVQRVVNGDVRQISITPSWAEALTDPELEEQVGIMRAELTTATEGTPSHEVFTSNLRVLESEVMRRNPNTPGGGEPLPDSIPVGMEFRIVGMTGEGGQPQEIPPELTRLFGDISRTGGTGQTSPLLLAAAMPTSGAGPGSWLANREPGFEEFIPGLAGGSGETLLRFLDPLPARGPLGPDVFTRFAGPARGAPLSEWWNLSRQLRPRWYSGTAEERILAESLFRQGGVSVEELRTLRAALRLRGMSGLTAAESELLRRVVAVHTQVAGATPTSPLLSLTELSPEEALAEFGRRGRSGVGTVTQRTYIVRVRINPADVGRVNEILARAPGAAGHAGNLAAEMEIVVAQDLARGGRGAGAPRILSITRNPSAAAPLGGGLGRALTWVGRGMVFLGAAVAVGEVVTAEGPNRRETQGRAFGSFAGATVVGAFAAGFCIGAGIATGGIALVVCAGLPAIAAGFGFGALGGEVGSWFD